MGNAILLLGTGVIVIVIFGASDWVAQRVMYRRGR